MFSPPEKQQDQEEQEEMAEDGGGSEVLSSRHNDYIHDVSFDCYGRRMATCSGDRFVRIWDYVLIENNNNNNMEDSNEEENLGWQLSSEFQAHRGSVTKVTWCHSEYGTLVATCSNSDVKIWEEQTPQQYQGAAKKSWTVKAHLTEARRDVTCLEFCPRTFGLQLATGSSDGICRMYEAVDLMNLSQWPIKASWSVDSSSVPSTFTSGGGGITCLSWCTSRFEPQTLALGTHTHVSLWRYHSPSRQYISLLSFPKHPGAVLSVAWAPNVGRRFHWIASCENGGALRVYQLKRNYSTTNDNNNDNDTMEEEDESNKNKKNCLELESIKILPSNQPLWKCQWNVTGTVLATSGDGGIVQLWKCDTSSGQWKCVSQINGMINNNTPTTNNEEYNAAVMINNNNNTIGSNSSGGSTATMNTMTMMQLG